MSKKDNESLVESYFFTIFVSEDITAYKIV